MGRVPSRGPLVFGVDQECHPGPVKNWSCTAYAHMPIPLRLPSPTRGEETDALRPLAVDACSAQQNRQFKSPPTNGSIPTLHRQSATPPRVNIVDPLPRATALPIHALCT
jgi:hypothetical protein